jgi:hypothetical protein
MATFFNFCKNEQLYNQIKLLFPVLQENKIHKKEAALFLIWNSLFKFGGP